MKQNIEHYMKARFTVLLFAALVCYGTIHAEKVQIGDLYYNLNTTDLTAEVTKSDNKYEGLSDANIPDIVSYNDVQYSITGIGAFAFQSCSSLTSVTIPNSVISIGNYAFSGCRNLTSITCSTTNTPTLGNNVFSNVDMNIPLYVPSGSIAAYWDAAGWKDFSNIQAIAISGDELPNDSTIIVSGTCGNNLTWALSYGCILIISGNGDMENYAVAMDMNDNDDYAPWSKYRHRIRNIHLSSGVTSIGSGAFSYCNKFTSVNIPNSVTNIGACAFEGCDSLTSIDIPNSFTSIGDRAFYMCIGLTSITLPNSITSIGRMAFHECISLTSVTIPNCVTSIGDAAFQSCISLTSINIPSGLTEIGYEVFANCSSLISIEIPSSVTNIAPNAFVYCSGLTSMSVETGNTVYDSRDSCNAIIETATNTLLFGCQNTVIPSSITSIGYMAFASCSSLTAIEIPGSVISIGEGAFSSCSGLTSITCRAAKAPELGANAFAFINKSIPLFVYEGCIEAYQAAVGWNEFSNIQAITDTTGQLYTGKAEINGLYYMLDGFALIAEVRQSDNNYSGLTIADIPSTITYNDTEYSVTSIGEAAFAGCSSLTSATIPSSVTSIGRSAFSGCNNLISVVIPSSVTSIGEVAFFSCSSLSSVVIPNSVTSIKDDTFGGCSGLESIVIGNSVTSIGRSAFYGCRGLTSLTIPNSVTDIGWEAFSGCNSLISISVDVTNPVYDSRDSCNAIVTSFGNSIILGCRNTIIPNSVTSIGELAFIDCNGLTHIDIPNSVTSIAQQAFENCTGLTSIDIPSSVKSIGLWAFSSCVNLTSITCRSTRAPQLGSEVFSYVNKSIPLYVPSGSITAYQAADGWKDFTNIRAIIEEEETVTTCGDEYIWNGMVLTKSGDYTVEADSTVIILHLTFMNSVELVDSITIYDNDSLIWHGRVLRESGTYCDTIMSMQTGCDSVITCLNLTVLPYVPPTVTIFGEEVVITDPEDSTVIMDEVDILGDSTLIYTPADNTLTLSDVLMEAGDSITAAISYTGSDPLTIVLCDSSTIVADTVIASTSDIIITGSGTLVAEGVVPIVGSSEATITFDSVSMIVRSLSSPAAVRRRIRGIIMVDENGGPALSGFASADFNKTAVTPPEAEYNEVTPEEAPGLTAPINAMFVRNGDGSKMILTEFTLTAIADPIDAVENISEDFRLAVSKCLINGQLYILLPDGTRYTTTGIKVE